jgi:hypothetical protein
MLNRSLLLAVAMASLLACVTVPAQGQTVLYNNGPDGNVGYYHVNFGAEVTNSFTLRTGASLTGVNLTLYVVDDRNTPLRLKWTVTTEPFGGEVKGEGFAHLTLLGNPYPTRFQLFAWPMGFALPNLELPAGTYYLQIQDVVTVWDTYAFWAQSSGGSSQAYYQPIAGNGAGGISLVPSEAFSILGDWNDAE